MLVELDVFSGRPNPHWELDESSSQTLRQLQAGLTTTDQAASQPPGLGYRGFLYSDPAGPVRAYRGYVTKTGSVLSDPSFSIERYLLDRVPAQYDALRRRIESELTSWK